MSQLENGARGIARQSGANSCQAGGKKPAAKKPAAKKTAAKKTPATKKK